WRKRPSLRIIREALPEVGSLNRLPQPFARRNSRALEVSDSTITGVESVKLLLGYGESDDVAR
ncbi:MAG TPA: hypothetical protein VFV28_02470, partial [Limnobacter sp.]|nr:hypothetical protein [Limnobacter sp.]